MKVISTPLGLRLSTLALVFCAPLAALQVALVARLPWWKLPQREMVAVAAVVMGATLLLRWGLLKGYRWVFTVTLVLAGFWSVVGAISAIRMKLPSVGFFTVFLLLYFSVIFFWIWRELGRSYFDSGMKWFQGLPRPISELWCELKQGEATVRCRVGRIDREGAIVFRAAQKLGEKELPPSFFQPKSLTDLSFSFRERKVQCQGRPVRELHHRSGAGFQFHAVSPDLDKELGQFIEFLRGEGYVE